MTEAPKPPEIVLVAHGNLDRVKELLAEDPSLLNIMFEPWKEDPLGAASHVGNRPIAEYLLEQGAPMTICTAAMLGQTETVRDFIKADASQANAKGAHDISLLFHTAMCGKVEIADMLVAHGGSTESAGHALHGAVMYGKYDMARWLLDRGAEPNESNFMGKTPLEVAQQREDSKLAELIESRGGTVSAS
jgi:hypothetical protein